LQAVIEAGIIPPLVQLLQNDEFEIKKEAAWAISNATSGGIHDQIKYYFFPCNNLLFLLNALAK
jgi:importin subunit alpha-1